MTQGEAEVAPARRRIPWRFVLLGGVLVAGAVVVVSLWVTRRARQQHQAAVRQLLAVLDHDYQTCILGEPAPDAELGKRIALAGLTGQLTYERAKDCADVAQAARAPLVEDAPDLSELGYDFVLEPGLPPDFGVCAHIERARAAAQTLGVESRPADCAEHLDPLAVTVDGGRDEVAAFAIDGELIDQVVDLEPPAERYLVRRTRDGSSWETSPPLTTSLPLVMSKQDVFGVKTDEHATRYALLDGGDWHLGAKLPDGGRIVAGRHVGSGWTLLDEWDDSPHVVRVDEKMDHVLETVPIPALHGRWTSEAPRIGTVEKDGSVIAYALEKDDRRHLVFEAHRIAAGAKPAPLSVLTFDHGKVHLEAHRCGPYVILPGIAVIVTPDGGKSFKALPGGERVELKAFDCTTDHLFTVSAHAFASCDHERCIDAPFPLMPHASLQLGVSAIGDRPRVLVAYRQHVVLFDADPKTARLSFARAWSRNDDERDNERPIFLIDGTWFTLPYDRLVDL